MTDDDIRRSSLDEIKQMRAQGLTKAPPADAPEAIRQALADVLDDLDTDPAAFWKRNDCLTSEKVFAERRARAALAEFDRLMNRRGGAPPREGDELPPDLAHLGPATRSRAASS